MDFTLILLIMFTFVIHLVGTLAYSARIAGSRTGRIAVSFALFNILILCSRISNSFQGPILAKRIEENLLYTASLKTVYDFRILLLSASIATLSGILLTPTFQRLFTLAVNKFSESRSVLVFMAGVFTTNGLMHLKESVTIPAKENIELLKKNVPVPARYILFNILGTAIWTTGVFSALYAGYLNPDIRVTSSQLSSVINGAATILMFIFVDPYISVLTDDTAHNRVDQEHFRSSIVWLSGSRFAGTILSQLLFIPAAMLIVFVAELI